MSECYLKSIIVVIVLVFMLMEKLIEDNFYNGQPMQYDIARLPEHIEDLELRILPKQNGAPIYFPKEADSREGESVNSVVLKKIW